MQPSKESPPPYVENVSGGHIISTDPQKNNEQSGLSPESKGRMVAVCTPEDAFRKAHRSRFRRLLSRLGLSLVGGGLLDLVNREVEREQTGQKRYGYVLFQLLGLLDSFFFWVLGGDVVRKEGRRWYDGCRSGICSNGSGQRVVD